MSFNYYDEIVGLFTTNYTLDYPYAMDDDTTRDPATGLPVDQPTNAPWLRVNSSSGDTINETIGTAQTIRKNEIFGVTVQIFLPRHSGGNNKVYTRKDFADIINHLDSFMIFNSIKTVDGALITMDQPPKTTDAPSPTPGDTWQQVNVTYNMEYRYI